MRRRGGEPIRKVLQIAPSDYHQHAARPRDPTLLPTREQRDIALIPQIKHVWQQMNWEGTALARCTVERLMTRLGVAGARHGKAVRTTIPDKALPRPLDRVNRQFKADRPKQLWVSDFTYISTW